jgi:hypothetical protein
LGGLTGTTLFVCTAPTSTPDVAREQMGGRIEVLEVAVPAALPPGPAAT